LSGWKGRGCIAKPSMLHQDRYDPLGVGSIMASRPKTKSGMPVQNFMPRRGNMKLTLRHGHAHLLLLRFHGVHGCASPFSALQTLTWSASAPCLRRMAVMEGSHPKHTLVKNSNFFSRSSPQSCSPSKRLTVTRAAGKQHLASTSTLLVAPFRTRFDEQHGTTHERYTTGLCVLERKVVPGSVARSCFAPRNLDTGGHAPGLLGMAWA
jgi:hypothetical protein